MKRKLLSLILTVASILVLVVSTGAIAAFAEGENTEGTEAVDTGFANDGEASIQTDTSIALLYTGLDSFEKIGDSDSIELYMLDVKNTAVVFAVKDKATGSVTYSAPAEASQIKSNETKFNLYSTGIVSYQDSQTVIQKCYTGQAVANGDYAVEKIDNGVRITYKFPDAKAGLGFTVPMTFTVEKNHFNASVEMNKIKTDKKSKSAITSIAVMPYYGAAKLNQDGYMFVPDGCGALIDNSFASLDGGVKYYSTLVYGRDQSLDVSANLGNDEKTTLPVFGTKAGNQAVFGIVDSGDAVAMVKAVSARGNFPYTTNYAEFIYNKTDVFKTKNTWNQKEYQQVADRPTNIDACTVQFYSLSGDNADYVGMANTYREYLTANGVSSKADSDLQFYLETVGAVKKTESVCGIVTDVVKPVTTYNAAKTIVNALGKSGIDNVNLRYTGWQKGGVESTVVTNSKTEGKLGSRKDLIALNKAVTALNGRTYLNVDFINIYSGKTGWGPNKFAARNILNNYALQNHYLLSTGMPDEDNNYYLIAPGYIDTEVSKFIKDFKDLGFNSLSAGSLGNSNYSDLNNSSKKFKDAQQTSDAMSDALKTIKSDLGKNASVMVDSGNAYSLKNADVVIGAPMYSNGYEMSYTDVPFVQIALHGLVTYTETAHNLSDDLQIQFLRQLETGAAPYYILTDEESSIFLDTNLNYIYSSQYKTWIDNASKDYSKLAKVLNGYCDKPITDHDVLTADVRATTYNNDRVVIVNYGSDDYNANGISVKAGGYTVMTRDEYKNASAVAADGAMEGGAE